MLFNFFNSRLEKWNVTFSNCEKKLIELLIEHLNNTKTDTVNTIRAKSNKYLTELKRTQ